MRDYAKQALSFAIQFNSIQISIYTIDKICTEFW